MTLNNAVNNALFQGVAYYNLPKDSERENEVLRVDLSNNRIMRELEQIREQAETAGRKGDDLSKAIKIMMRIIEGDIVPDRDDRFLLENFPEMHMKAWMIRRAKEEPVKHDSLFEDDDERIAKKIPGVEVKFPEISKVDFSDLIAGLDVIA